MSGKKPRKPIQVGLTDDERDLLDKASEIDGISVAGFLRQAGVRAARSRVMQNLNGEVSGHE